MLIGPLSALAPVDTTNFVVASSTKVTVPAVALGVMMKAFNLVGPANTETLEPCVVVLFANISDPAIFSSLN
jgi:hypothetical protein